MTALRVLVFRWFPTMTKVHQPVSDYVSTNIASRDSVTFGGAETVTDEKVTPRRPFFAITTIKTNWTFWTGIGAGARARWKS